MNQTSRLPRSAWSWTFVLGLFISLGAPLYANDAASTIEALIAKGEATAALAELDAAAGLEPAQTALLRTLAHNALGDWKSAIPQGEQATELLPESVAAHLAYAKALATKMSDVGGLKAMGSLGPYKKAVARALALEPNNADARAEEIGFLMHAPGIAGGNKTQARAKIDDLATIDPTRALRLRIELAALEDDPETRIAGYQELIALKPEDHAAKHGLALVLQQQKRFPEADALLDALRQGDDVSWRLAALYQLGRSRVLGDYELETALRHFDDFIAQHDDSDRSLPSRAAAHWRKGLALEQLDREPDARAAYQAALALDASFEAAQKALEALK